MRQVYAYARFWDAKEVMLLYPGNTMQNRKDEYLTDDYKNIDQNKINGERIKHTAQMASVSVLKGEGELDNEIGGKILKQLIG